MYLIRCQSRLMAKLLLIVVGVCCAQVGYTQDYAYWHTLPAKDLGELKAVIQDPDPALDVALARAIGRQDIQQGLKLLNAMNPGTLNEEIQIYREAITCLLAVQHGDLSLAKPNCDALLMVESIQDRIHPSVAAQAYSGLGAWSTRLGDAQMALERLDMGLECAAKANDRNLLAILHHNRSLPLVMLGMPDLAVSSLEMSRRYQDAVPADSQLPAILLHNLAYVQAQRGGHESAIEEFYKVISWAESLGQDSRAYIAVTQLAHSFNALDRSEEAIETLLPWVLRTDYARTPDTHADALRALGQAYLATGNMIEAQRWLLQGLRVAREHDNLIRVQELSLAWVDLLLESARFSEAVAELEQLIAQTNPTSQLHADALLRMSAGQHKLGNYASAYEHLRRHQAVDETIRTEGFDRRLSALRAANDLDLVNYELAVVRERERTAQERTEQDRVNRNIVILASILFGVVGFMLFRRNLDRRQAKAQAALTEQLQQTISERTREIEAEMSLRIAAEKAKSELEKRVAEDERLRTIGQLTGGVAHDFNNLLTVILLSADLLKSDQGEDLKSLLDDIIHAGESGRATTQSLLAYARQQELQPETLELQQFLRQRASLFERTLGGAIDLEVVAEESAMVVVDPGQLTTCLINLLFNAREAMNDTGKVQILLNTQAAERVDIVVSDTGPGMVPGVLGRATEPFFTTKTGSSGGTGLGLSMVYGFMKQTGGELNIRSKQDPQHKPLDGFGTSVYLTFSLEDTPNIANVASVEFGLPTRSGRTALLIEDQSAVRDVCRAALKRLGFEVLEAETGVEAMEWILEGRDLDLVITDALMPGGVSGLDVVNALGSLYKDLPVVLMSGGPVEPPDNCVFLMKPFSLAELEETVRRIVHEAPVVEIKSS